MRVAIYARVSTDEQNVETQLRPLWRFCEARGWDVCREYVDVGYTGKTAARPELEAMMRDAGARKFAAVLVWKFDRLFRSVDHMLQALDHFRTLGIDFVSMTESIDTTTPAGKMVFTMLAAMAEFERDLIRERTQAGMARARAAGKQIGRPRRQLDTIRLLQLKKTMSLRKIAKTEGIALGTLYNAIGKPLQKCPAEFLNGEAV